MTISPLETLRRFDAPHRRWLALLVLIGAVVRVAVNDVASYSPGDEAHFIDISRWLDREGMSAYPEFVSTYLDREAMWLSPTPLRWGYFVLTTFACSASGTCDGRTIAWLSTLAGIASLLLTYELGKRLAGRNVALLATAFSVLSPLQLALGRRALQDEVYAAAFLAAFVTLVQLVDTASSDRRAWKKRTAWFVAASTLALSIKEAFVFPYAALVAIYAFVRRDIRARDVGIFAAAPALYCLGFVALGRDASALFELIRIDEASFASDYSIQYQSGPAHRPLFDLFLLAPVVCLFATAALGKMTEKVRELGREKWLAAFLILVLAAFMGLPKNLRFVVILDPVLRLLAAWIVVNHAWMTRATRATRAAIATSIVMVNGAIEYSLFDTIFRRRNIYDPTTYEILTALGAIPGKLASTETNPFVTKSFLALGAVLAIVLLVRRRAMTETKEGSESANPSRIGTPAAVAVGAASLLLAFFAGRISAQDAQLATTQVQSVATNPVVAPQAPRDPMAEGLDALYAKKDPAKAALRFREVLATQPNHYGATYQLAAALDQSGDAAGALATWSKMLPMAEAIGDQATATQARARIAALAPPPPVPEDPAAEGMRLGLAALYEKKDATEAIKLFREVLAKNPQHYGATYQLATALDKAGKRDEAKSIWKTVLQMAEANKDEATAQAARERLGKELVFRGFQ